MNANRTDTQAEPLSAILTELSQDAESSVSLGEIVDRFGRRAFGALLFIFAIPNVLPLPPGSSTVLGLPLLLLAPQVAIGVRSPWLPRLVDEKRFKATDLHKLLGGVIPRLKSIERISKPRLLFMFGPVGDRLIGLICTLLAFVLILPIPLGNLAPALCIGALSLGLFQRDGVIALVGYLIAAISLGLLVVSAGAVAMALARVIAFFGG